MTTETVTIHRDEFAECGCPWCVRIATHDEYVDIDDVADNRQKLSDWHDHSHGLSLWASCPYEPCKLLTDDFRKTP
jgi:hypothetical protein